MTRRLLLSCSAVLSVALGAQDTAATKSSLLAADRAAAASVEALAKALSDDATVLVPDAPILAGRIAYQRVVATLGTVVLVGGIVAHFFYWQAFVSVWCFFAAAASGLILFHFEKQRTARLLPVGR